MIRRFIALTSMVVLGCTMPALAGTVSGKIKLGNATNTAASASNGDKETAVVWLEGQQDSKPPETPVKISQKNLQFSPDFLVAVKGQRVDMPNDDDVAHNVFSFTGMNQFNLGIYPKGEFRSVTFDKTGIVDMFCSIHRHMHARILVVPTRYYASTLPGQTFNINDVPPGHYTLKVWHERSRMYEKNVVVPKTGIITESIVLENGPAPVTTATK